MKKFLKIVPYFLWTVLFIVIPLIFIFYFSFKSKNGSFTFLNYVNFFNLTYLKVFFTSLKLSIMSTFLCFIFGFPLAVLLSKIKSERKRNLLALFFIIPLWTNFLLRTYSWLSIFREQGIINQLLISIGLINKPIQFLYNDYAILIGMVYNFLPFMVLPIYIALINIDKDYIEVAMDLGAKGKDLYFKIIIPFISPAILSGAIMVFMPSVTTFIISDLLGGSQKMMLGNLIQREFMAARNWEMGSSISVIMIFVLFVLFFILKKINKGKNEFSEEFNIW